MWFVKKAKRYMCIRASCLKFIDLCAYLAPGYSLDLYIKVFGSVSSSLKFAFPYECLTSLQALFTTTSLPPKEAFYSRLKKSHISDLEYERCQTIWNENSCTNLDQFLRLYNENGMFTSL